MMTSCPRCGSTNLIVSRADGVGTRIECFACFHIEWFLTPDAVTGPGPDAEEVRA